MHRILIILSIIIISSSTVSFSQTGKIDISTRKELIKGKPYYIHKVEKGQTSYSIAKAYNILVSELASENPVVFDSLSVGQDLNIPVIKGRNFSLAEIQLADKFNYHYIEKGQTPYSVAKIFESDTETLFKWNPDAKTSFIPGQVLRMPKKGVNEVEIKSLLDADNNTSSGLVILADSSSYVLHEVVKGNTLYSISKLYNVDINQIVELNPGCDKGLSIGQMLKIKKSDVVQSAGSPNVQKPASQNQISKPLVDSVKVSPDFKMIEHKVLKGETLYSLSKKYNISKDDILQYNKGLDQTLTIGQIIFIPVLSNDLKGRVENKDVIGKDTDEFVREDSRFYYHKVEVNESLTDISRFYHIKTKKIEKYNSYLKDREIIPGDILKISKKDIRDISLVVRHLKEKYDKVTQVKNSQIVNNDSIVDAKDENPNYFDNNEVINIALMLPFYLTVNDTLGMSDTLQLNQDNDNADPDISNKQDAFAKPEIKIYDKSKVFLEFYEGFLLAVDTLNNSGINLNVHAYDTEKNADKVSKILEAPEMEDMDIIFGPVYDDMIAKVDVFAEKNKIIVVSPVISGNNDKIKNPEFFRAIPSNETQIKGFCDVLSEYYHQNIVIMHYGTEQEMQNIELYKKYLLPAIYAKTDSSKVKFKIVKLNKDKAFDIIKPRRNENEKEVFDHPIKNALNEEIPNLVIIPSKDRGFISNTIRQLNTIYEEVVSDYQITVAGFSNARNFENIDLQYLHNLEFHTFTSSYIDYTDSDVKEFIRKYREKYKTEPSQFSFQGYDLLWYFVNAETSYGNAFYKKIDKLIESQSVKCLQNEFDFQPVRKGGVFENNHVYVLKYEQNYDLIKVSKPSRSFVPGKKVIEKADKKNEVKSLDKDENNLRLYRSPE